MDDWKPKIDAWEPRLAEWNARYAAEYARLARARRGWFRKLTPGEEADVAAAARRLTGEEVAIELFDFIGALCDAYIAEPLPQNRAKIRAWVGANPNFAPAVWSYARQSPELIRKPGDEPRLLRGLAAASIDDVRTDYRALIETLGDLWVAACRAGIDPAPSFEKVAALSNPGTGGGGAFMQGTLREFRSSAHFRDRVRPRLPRACA
jgi:hypothetical protein